MTKSIRLLWNQIDHLRRMRGYLEYSLKQVMPLMPVADWADLTPHQHESLAAVRLRFSEFQEHLGKTMRVIAREEEKYTEPFSAVLLYMEEKLDILDSAEHWKLIRELRNSVNHEYEEIPDQLSALFATLTQEIPQLFDWFNRLHAVCKTNYPVPVG